jgi:excisionase family DNA binding protein
MNVERLLTPKETADLLGVAETTLAIWRCTRRVVLPFVKIGKFVRYKPDDVSAFVAERTRTATAHEGGL